MKEARKKTKSIYKCSTRVLGIVGFGGIEYRAILNTSLEGARQEVVCTLVVVVVGLRVRAFAYRKGRCNLNGKSTGKKTEMTSWVTWPLDSHHLGGDLLGDLEGPLADRADGARDTRVVVLVTLLAVLL